MVSKVIIVTGASRGIGLAVAKYLLNASHKVVLVSRTKTELEAIKAQYPSQVEFLAADLTDTKVDRRPCLLRLSCQMHTRAQASVLNLTTGSPEANRAGCPILRSTRRPRCQPWCALAHAAYLQLQSRGMEKDLRCEPIQRTCPGR